jgi:hypothetical protein
MTSQADINACTNLPNVKGLSRAQNRVVGATVATWTNYSCAGYNLGEEYNGGRAYHLAGLFARRWQAAINAGAQLPNLYIVHIGWAGQGFQQADVGHDRWWVGRDATDIESLYPLSQNVLARGIQNLQAAGKRPRIIGLHWNQWEAEAMNNTVSSAADAQAKFSAFIASLRAVTGSAAYPIYLYRPRIFSVNNAASTSYVASAFTALASAPTPNVFQLIDVVDATNAGGSLVYNSAASPNFGVYNDGVHYTRVVQEWFAAKQWELVFSSGQYGAPVE